MKPGAMHRARFTSRLLDTLKIFIFRNNGFHLTYRNLKGLKDMRVFAAKFYCKSWFSSSLEISAPKNDFQLAREFLSSGDQI